MFDVLRAEETGPDDELGERRADFAGLHIYR
jgi:hypothetical protein